MTCGELGAAAQDGAHGSYPGRDHPTVGQLSDAHRHIDMVVHEADHPVAKHQPDVDLRKESQELRDDRQNMQAAEECRRRQHQLASRRRELTGRLALRLLHLLQNSAGSGSVGNAGIGESKLARGTGQQLSFESHFEFGNLAAERGYRDVECTCSSR